MRIRCNACDRGEWLRRRARTARTRLPRMADSSFDIVSKVDHQEAENALNQARKEIEQRYDFKGTGASVEWSGESMLIKASTEERAKAVLDVFQSKLIKRGISLKSLESGEPFAERQGVPDHLDDQGRHLAGEREEDRQDHPRRGSQGRQVADPGRRAARAVQEPRRPAGGPAPAEGRRPRRRPPVRQLPVVRAIRMPRPAASARLIAPLTLPSAAPPRQYRGDSHFRGCLGLPAS